MDNSVNLSNSEKKLALNGTETTSEQEPLKKLYIVRKDAQREKKGGKPWCCDLGAKLSPSGKRVRRYFSSKKEAEEEGRVSQNAYHELRRQNVEPENSLFYSRLVKILEGTDILPEVAATLVKEMWETVKNAESKKPEYFRACFKEGYLSLERKKLSVTFEKAAFHLREENEKKQKAGHLRDRSAKNTEDILKRFLKANPKIAKKYLSELNKEELEEALKNAVPNSATSRKKMRAVLSTVFSFGINRGWCKENQVKFISVPLVKEEEIVCLNPEKVLSLLNACRIPTQQEKELQVVGNLSWMRGIKRDCRNCLPVVAIMIFTGMRPEEVKRLKWEDVNFETGMIHVEPKVSKKTGGMRALTLNETLRKWLSFFLKDNRGLSGNVIPDGWEVKWAGIRYRAGFGDGKWQNDCLRHTFATMYLLKYADYKALMIEMDHADTELIRSRYCNTRGLSKQAAEDFWKLSPYSENEEMVRR